MGVEEKQMNAQITTAAKAAGTGNAGMPNIDFGSLDIYGKRRRRRIALALLAIVIIVAAAVELEGVLHQALTPKALSGQPGKTAPASEVASTFASAFFYNPINVTYTGTLSYMAKESSGAVVGSASIPLNIALESRGRQYRISFTSNSVYFDIGNRQSGLPLNLTIINGSEGLYVCSSGSYFYEGCMNSSVFSIALLNNLSGAGNLEFIHNVSSLYQGIGLNASSSEASEYNGAPCTLINGTATGVPNFIRAHYKGAQVQGHGSFSFCLSDTNQLPLEANFEAYISVYNQSNTSLSNVSPESGRTADRKANGTVLFALPPPAPTGGGNGLGNASKTTVPNTVPTTLPQVGNSINSTSNKTGRMPGLVMIISISFIGHFGSAPEGTIGALTEPLVNLSTMLPSWCSPSFGSPAGNATESCRGISLNSTGSIGFYFSQKEYASLELTGISCVSGVSASNSSSPAYLPEAANMSEGKEAYVTASCPLFGNPPYTYRLYAEYNVNGNPGKGLLATLHTYKTTAGRI